MWRSEARGVAHSLCVLPRPPQALAALFMMNNVHYMVKTVESSAELMLLGEEWLERHKDRVEEWGAAYQALSWGPLIEALTADLQPAARTDKVSDLR